MDFSTIKNQMEAKDGTGYKNVREISADARLVFKNAMKYNDERSDVHVMAKTLLGKFEEKWLQLLPKVTEEEKRREDEEVEAKLDMQLAQEAAHAKMARDLSNELYEADMHLEELRDIVVQKCRKMSTEEKRKLGVALTRLSPEDLTKALEIVARNNPGFQATAEEVDLDIDVQTESTLWRLKILVKDVLEVQGKSAASTGGNNNNNNKNASNNNKRKREICDAIAKTAKKRKRVGKYVWVRMEHLREIKPRCRGGDGLQPTGARRWKLLELYRLMTPLKAEEWKVHQKVKDVDAQLQCQRRRCSLSSL
ncbi:transcription factor GTE6-like [Populus alba x Populus x berolinensis]|uniref:Transcription factor GTE6-like n=1 Tax=Populus alba x Populus x berolinensis TaxID=444605 RepID=A0AAD6Q9Z5_9ROSI|nr:transcription factor GTE6-like [Populus alba x Populus x berolinensis]